MIMSETAHGMLLPTSICGCRRPAGPEERHGPFPLTSPPHEAASFVAHVAIKPFPLWTVLVVALYDTSAPEPPTLPCIQPEYDPFGAPDMTAAFCCAVNMRPHVWLPHDGSHAGGKAPHGAALDTGPVQ